MKLKHNPIFQKHKTQIEEALYSLPHQQSSTGWDLFKKMVIASEDLDNASVPQDGIIPTTQIIILKRDHFHKCCRDLGEWMSEHLPNLNLKWD
jgi:hypothetical protein